jgi:hypothetical protein
MVGFFLQNFPIGYCDHSSFPLCFFNWLCSQSSTHSSTAQTLTNCRNSEELWVKLCDWHCTMTFLLNFLWERVFLEFLTWFNLLASLQWKATIPTATKKELCHWLSIRLLRSLLMENLSNGRQLFLPQPRRPYITGFPLGCCDHS